MKWTTHVQDRHQWHRWLAWYPVDVSYEEDNALWIRWAWLETVERRDIDSWDDGYGIGPLWEYRAL